MPGKGVERLTFAGAVAVRASVEQPSFLAQGRFDGRVVWAQPQSAGAAD
jgi:hypothetical protein